MGTAYVINMLISYHLLLMVIYLLVFMLTDHAAVAAPVGGTL